MADHNYPSPILILCRACGSQNVRRDAYAEWDDEAQIWVLASVFDHGICDDCGAENSLVERWKGLAGDDGIPAVLGPVSADDYLDSELELTDGD